MLGVEQEEEEERNGAPLLASKACCCTVHREEFLGPDEAIAVATLRKKQSMAAVPQFTLLMGCSSIGLLHTSSLSFQPT